MAIHIKFPLISNNPASTTPYLHFINMLGYASKNEKPLKILDLMIFNSLPDKRPSKWLFTNTQGILTRRDIASMNLNDLIKAILENIEDTNKPISHSDILVLQK